MASVTLPIAISSPECGAMYPSGAWRSYLFNFNGDPGIKNGEVNHLRNIGLSFAESSIFILTRFLEDEEELGMIRSELIEIDEPLLLLAISIKNSAHAISEITSFVNMYRRLENPPRVAVCGYVRDFLPFMYQLIELLIPPERIVLLDPAKRYLLREGWIRRNTHMNTLKTWRTVPYSFDGQLVRFRDLGRFLPDHDDSPECLMRLARQTYEECRHDYPPHPDVMLVKTSADTGMSTPDRAMTITPSAKYRLELEGISVLAIDDFADIRHYLTTLYQARNLITSYGGAACTNRWFAHPDARVIVLGNLAYRWEYNQSCLIDSSSSEVYGVYWHMRHSHLFPVRQMDFLLDQPNEFTDYEAGRLVGVLRAS